MPLRGCFQGSAARYTDTRVKPYSGVMVTSTAAKSEHLSARGIGKLGEALQLPYDIVGISGSVRRTERRRP